MLQVGSFEGGQFSANGQATTNNLFLVDGQNDNDSRRGGSQGTQARVSLDSMAEYQVQTHTYAAEYGGSTGVVVNSVTKSGTNKLQGRVFEYYQSNELQATNYFPEAGRPEESGFGQQRLRRQSWRPDRQEQSVLLRQLRGHTREHGRQPQLPGRGGAARGLVLDDDRVSWAEHVCAFRLPLEPEQPDQLPLDA